MSRRLARPSDLAVPAEKAEGMDPARDWLEEFAVESKPEPAVEVPPAPQPAQEPPVGIGRGRLVLAIAIRVLLVAILVGWYVYANTGFLRPSIAPLTASIPAAPPAAIPPPEVAALYERAADESIQPRPPTTNDKQPASAPANRRSPKPPVADSRAAHISRSIADGRSRLPEPATPSVRVAAPSRELTTPAAAPPPPVAPVRITTGPVGVLPDARTVPLTAPAPPAAEPPAARAAETSAVLAVVDRYRQAFNTLDASAVEAFWRDVDVKALKRAFDRLDEQSFHFDNCPVELSESHAIVSCQGIAKYVPKVGGRTPRVDSRRWTFTLGKMSNSWVILSVDSRPGK